MSASRLAPTSNERHASGCLLTPAEVAERLAVSRSMAYKLFRTGELPVLYVGRLPRVTEVDLEAYLERCRQVAR